MTVNIIKIGSQVLTTPLGKIDLNLIRTLTNDMAQHIVQTKTPLIIISSGSVVCGSEQLNIVPKTIPDKQAAAAVGQILLMEEYGQFFRRFGLTVAQLLLTHDAFHDPKKRLNTKNTLQALLDKNIIPIINENDTVATDEISFGDNDQLASLTACLMSAKQLVILTNVDGVYKNDTVIQTITNIDSCTIDQLAADRPSMQSKGGMHSKLTAAKQAALAGISVVITNGRKPNVICDALQNKPVGTSINAIRSI